MYVKEFIPIPKPIKPIKPIKPKTKTTRTIKTKKTVGSTKKRKEHSASWWRNKALEQAQKLAKYRESYGGATAEQRYCHCISCGRELHLSGKEDRAEGGHYVTRTCRATEIELDNIHPQCHYCNCALGGNAVAYRRNLIKKIGEERVTRLELMYAGYRGDEEALAQLNERDQIEVIRKKPTSYYKAKCEEFVSEIKKIKESW